MAIGIAQKERKLNADCHRNDPAKSAGCMTRTRDRAMFHPRTGARLINSRHTIVWTDSVDNPIARSGRSWDRDGERRCLWRERGMRKDRQIAVRADGPTS